MPTNDFLPFATDPLANVLPQADWAVLPAVGTGFQPGLAESEKCNKAWRQSSFVSSCVAQLIVDILGVDALDDGDVNTFVANLTLAIAATAQRIKLQNNATYYVSTAGSDANNGSLGSPWATLQHSWDWIQSNLDFNGHIVQVIVADGTYSGGLIADGPIVGMTGALPIRYTGDIVTPANCVISVNSASPILARNGGRVYAEGFKFVNTGPGDFSNVAALGSGSFVYLGAVLFGTGNTGHMAVTGGGTISLLTDYAIDGGAPYHYSSAYGGFILGNAITVSLSGTPAFATAFAVAQSCGTIQTVGNTYSGAATGVRYVASLNGVIVTAGGGVNYYPGNAPGTTGAGGQYNS